MSACKTYALESSECDCLLNISTQGNTIQIQLAGATVYRVNSSGDFRIQGVNGGANIASDSDFTVSDVETLICSCNTPVGGTGGGGSSSETPLDICQVREVITGAGTWNRPADTKSVGYVVREVGDINDPPTLTDSNGTTNLYLDESVSWSVDESQDSLSGTFTITSKINDVIIIVYSRECP